jgi:CBS-domain-containing membrane protein
MSSVFSKIRGGGARPPAASPRQVLNGLIGGGLAISIIAAITRSYHVPLLMAPLGASCFLIFAVPDVPFAQPRNVVFGHLLSSLVGLIFVNYVGVGPIQMGVAVGVASAVMLYTRTSHPPAGADPLVVMIAAGKLGWSFLATPVLVSTVILVLVALLVNNVGKDKAWPKYWF